MDKIETILTSIILFGLLAIDVHLYVKVSENRNFIKYIQSSAHTHYQPAKTGFIITTNHP